MCDSMHEDSLAANYQAAAAMAAGSAGNGHLTTGPCGTGGNSTSSQLDHLAAMCETGDEAVSRVASCSSKASITLASNGDMAAMAAAVAAQFAGEGGAMGSPLQRASSSQFGSPTKA
jgi:hypothetical protein